MLPKLLKDKMEKEKMSLRDTAKQTGVAHTTIDRILKGKNVDMSTLKTVCDWIGVSASDVLDDLQGRSSLAQKVTIVMEKEPRLGELFEEIVRDMEAGDLTNEEVSDIVNYASYRLNLKRIGRE